MKRVWTKVVSVWDGERYVTDESRSEWYLYDGPCDEMKGSDVANKQRQEELDMQKAAIARQNAQQDYVKGLTDPFVTGSGQGFDPQMLALLRTQALAQNNTAFNSVGNSLRSSLLARGAGGGNAPVGGDFIKGTLGLQAAKADSQNSALNNIGLQDLQTALNNRWNAMSILNGQPAQLNTQIGSAAGAASSALESYIKAANSGFLSSFGDALGGALGKGLGQMGIGAASGGLNSITGTKWFGGGQQ